MSGQVGAREAACLHDSGCDGRSHSLFCNDAWFYPKANESEVSR